MSYDTLAINAMCVILMITVVIMLALAAVLAGAGYWGLAVFNCFVTAGIGWTAASIHSEWRAVVVK